MIKNYRKKPVVIEAVQLTPELAAKFFKREIEGPFGLYISGTYIDQPGSFEVKDAYVMIDTLEGTMKASLYDYIIKGINGELYPCKPDIFEKTYEEVYGELPLYETRTRFVEDENIPVIPPLKQNPITGVKCGECGMIWKGAMGYVCPNLRCPIQLKVTC